MTTVNFFNEKGNVSAKVRDGIRPQILAKAIEVLKKSDTFENVEKNADGGISIPIAIDEKSGNTIFAHFSMTISNKSPETKTERKKAEKTDTKTEKVIPTLFE